MMYEKEITKGAALLDQHFPDWEWRVNVEQLELKSCTDCVLGQLCGTFDYGMKMLDLYGASAAHGFSISAAIDHPTVWLPLTSEWCDYILKRRAAAEAIAPCSSSFFALPTHQCENSPDPALNGTGSVLKESQS